MFTVLGPYLTSTTIALAIGAVIVATLFRPLFAVVADLCGTRDRALFWTVYLSVVLILVPVLAVAYVSTYGDRLGHIELFIQRGIFYALFGLTGAVLAIGWGIWRATNRVIRMQERAIAAPPEASTTP
jgi:nitrate reductase NapE component